MWESAFQGVAGVVVASLVGFAGPFLLWQRREARAEERRRADELAERVALVRTRAFAVAEAADREFRLNPYYRPLVQLGEAIFALTATLPSESRGLGVDLERKFVALTEEIRRHRWRRWFPGGSERVVQEALGIASCAQAWHASRASRLR